MAKYKSGKTPLIKIDPFCEKFSIANLLVKDESKNHFGTFKDRRSEVIIKKAIDEYVDKLCLISSGNAGYSLARFAESSGIKVFSVIDKNLNVRVRKKLEKVCRKIIIVDLSGKILMPEEVIDLCRESKEVIWDVTNGWHEAYESIIMELREYNPDCIICPVGSGEGFVGLFNGIRKCRLKTKLIGVTVKESPSFADKLHTPWTPYAKKIKSILGKGNKLIKLTEKEIKSSYQYGKRYFDCEPSSAVVLGAFGKIRFKKEDKIVIINTGKGLF